MSFCIECQMPTPSMTTFVFKILIQHMRVCVGRFYVMLCWRVMLFM